MQNYFVVGAAEGAILGWEVFKIILEILATDFSTVLLTLALIVLETEVLLPVAPLAV